MKKNRHHLLTGLLALVLSLTLTFGALASEEDGDEVPVEATTTINGVVNDTYQIVTDHGTVYEIGVTDAGDELIQHPGERAEARGQVVDDNGQNVIYVLSFRIIPE